MVHDGFPLQEYDERWVRVTRRLEDFSVDALVVTTRVNIEYLTGHDAEGAYAAPYALIVAPNVPRTCVVRAYNRFSIESEAIPLDLVTYFGRRDMVQVWAETMRRLGLDRARVGLELDHWGLAPADASRFRDELPRAQIVDCSRAVTSVAEVKSPAELQVMRRVAGYTDLAVNGFYASLRAGVTEEDAAARVERDVAAAGSRTRDMTMLFGARTGLPHGRVSAQALSAGDVAFIEVSGFDHGYAAGLCRTAVLGRHPEAEALHQLAEEATQAAIDALHPGAIASEVDRAARDVVERAGRGGTFLQRTGYAIGLGWYDRGYLSLEPGADDVIEEGSTFHLPRILFDERHRFGVGTSETVLVNAGGVEVFSSLPRSIRLIDP